MAVPTREMEEETGRATDALGHGQAETIYEEVWPDYELQGDYGVHCTTSAIFPNFPHYHNTSPQVLGAAGSVGSWVDEEGAEMSFEAMDVCEVETCLSVLVINIEENEGGMEAAGGVSIGFGEEKNGKEDEECADRMEWADGWSEEGDWDTPPDLYLSPSPSTPASADRRAQASRESPDSPELLPFSTTPPAALLNSDPGALRNA
jgi:hypothetical protein